MMPVIEDFFHAIDVIDSSQGYESLAEVNRYDVGIPA